MLDRDADLRMVRTADRAVHYVLTENMVEFLEIAPCHRGSARMGCRRRGASSRRNGRARKGFASAPPRARPSWRACTSSAAAPRSTIRPWARAVRPDWIKLDGLLDNVTVSFLSRKIEEARQQKKNLFILEIDSPGGTEAAGDRIADILSRSRT